MSAPTATTSSIQRGARKGRIGLALIAAIVVVIVASGGIAAYYLFFRPPGPEIVRVDGSSTVFPITSAWATDFNNPDRQVIVAFSGTGGGFAKFCRGETDLSDASRPIRQTERDLCTQNGITGIVEFLVAYDGLSLVVPVANTWAQNLTVSQLCRIWTSNASAGACGGAGGRVTRWSQIDPGWPDAPIELYGPGTDSGTFDYFVEVIFDGVEMEHTDQHFQSEDDNVLVQGVSSNQYALGYFGYAYAVENTDKLRILAIDNETGAGPIAPSHDTIRNGTYSPLSRPLFVYASAASLARQVVRDFLTYGYSDPGTVRVDETGYVSLTLTERQAQRSQIP
ncbi:MAG: PstS family phosphate ABC transporter substrate-binding protein [Methanobacteriota archaeon]